MKKSLIYIFFLFTFFIGNEVFGQQNHTMYGLTNLAQSHYENPAFQPRGEAYFALGLGNHSFGLNHSGFALQQVLTKRQQDDSLIFSQQSLLNALAERNYLLTDVRNEILGMAFNFTDVYWGIFISHRLSTAFYYPKDLMVLGVEGNGRSLLGNRASIDDLGLKLDGYMEYGFTYGRSVNEKLRLGGKLKLLSGYANINSIKSKLGLHTDENDFTLTLDGKLNMRSSGLQYLFDTTGIDGWDVNPGLMFNFKNIGVALDFGFTYKFHDKMELNGSLLDLGIIRWKNQVTSYETDDLDFTFQGINMNAFLQDSLNYLEELGDSLLQKIENDQTHKPYTTMLSSRFYLGFKYSPKDWFSVGVTSYNQIVANKIRPAAIISATLMARNIVAFTANYSYAGRAWNNIGLGLSLRLGAIQVYAMTDNILGLNYTNAKNLHVSAGLNLMFGRYAKKKVAPSKGVKWVDVESGNEVENP